MTEGNCQLGLVRWLASKASGLMTQIPSLDPHGGWRETSVKLYCKSFVSCNIHAGVSHRQTHDPFLEPVPRQAVSWRTLRKNLCFIENGGSFFNKSSVHFSTKILKRHLETGVRMEGM